MGGRFPAVISYVECMQAKRRLLYNFNKSSSFSDIFDSCLLKLSLLRSSPHGTAVPHWLVRGARDKHLKFGRKGFLSLHIEEAVFLLLKKWCLMGWGALSACGIMYLCRSILFFLINIWSEKPAFFSVLFPGKINYVLMSFFKLEAKFISVL